MIIQITELCLTDCLCKAVGRGRTSFAKGNSESRWHQSPAFLRYNSLLRAVALTHLKRRDAVFLFEAAHKGCDRAEARELRDIDAFHIGRYNELCRPGEPQTSQILCKCNPDLGSEEAAEVFLADKEAVGDALERYILAVGALDIQKYFAKAAVADIYPTLALD